MGITPLDIQNKEFERSFRGYDIEDVDDFLDRVAKDLEQLIRENMELKETVEQLKDKNKNYYKMEETMHNAIVVAQETAEEVKNNARREADFTRREAEKEAQRIVEEARSRSGKILEDREELFKQAKIFKMRFRSFMEAQLAGLESEDWMDDHKAQALDGGLRKKTLTEGERLQDIQYETRGEQVTPAAYALDSKAAFDPAPSPEAKPASKREGVSERYAGPDYPPVPEFKSPSVELEATREVKSPVDYDSQQGLSPRRDAASGEEPKYGSPDFDPEPGSRSRIDYEPEPLSGRSSRQDYDSDPKPEYRPRPDIEPEPMPRSRPELETDSREDYQTDLTHDAKQGYEPRPEFDADREFERKSERKRRKEYDYNKDPEF